MPTPKLDHSAGGFRVKAALRIAAIQELGTETRVLDAFAGKGDLWRCVEGQVGPLSVMHVDKAQGGASTLHADNRRVLRSLDLSRFDLVDLDAYSMPTDQVEILARRRYQGPIVWTCISVAMGGMPRSLLRTEGIPDEWRQLCPTLFSHGDLLTRWTEYLALHGWTHHCTMALHSNGQKFYGVSTTDRFLITKKAVLTSYNVLTQPKGRAHDERDQDQMG